MTEEQQALSEALTHLQRMVVLNMVTGQMTQRKAYYAAGGKAKTDKAADTSVSNMLSKVEVKAFYDSLVASTAASAVMTREEALDRLSEIARTTVSDVAKFAKHKVGEDDQGNPIHMSVWELKDQGDIAEPNAAAISELSSSPQGLKFKLHSPLMAIKQIAELEGWEAPTKIEVNERPPLLVRKKVKAEASDDSAEDS